MMSQFSRDLARTTLENVASCRKLDLLTLFFPVPC